MNYTNLGVDSALSREFSKMGMTVRWNPVVNIYDISVVIFLSV